MSLIARVASSCYKHSKSAPTFNLLQQTRWISDDSTKPGTTDTPLTSLKSTLAEAKSSKPDSSLGERFDFFTNPGSFGQQADQDKAAFDMSDLARHLQSSQYLGDGPYRLHINATFNNTILTLASPKGQVIAATSGGTAGFKKAARSGYEAAHQAALQLIAKMQEKNLQIVNFHIIFKGFGPGRDAAFKAFTAQYGSSCKQLTDATPVPFGGCRPKKARRL
jgi:small subunit ribosomal protein S11